MGDKTRLKYGRGINYKKVIDHLNHINEITDAEFTEDIPGHDIYGKKIDERDFSFMAYFFPIKGETQAEKDESIKKQFREMVIGFVKDDKDIKKKYLDYMYDGMDSLFENMNKPVKTNEDLIKLVACFKVGQTVSVKRKENLEYFNKRYPTKNEQAAFCGALMNLDTLSWDFSVLKNKHKEFSLQGFMPLEHMKTAKMDQISDFALSYKSEIEHNSDIINYVIPNDFVESFEQNYNSQDTGLDISKFLITNNYTSYLGGEEAKSSTNLSYDAHDFVFIGNKSAKEVAIEKLENDPAFQAFSENKKRLAIHKQAELEFKRALVNGREVVTVVTPRRDGNKVVYSEKKIKPIVKDLPPTEADLNKHSWFRKKFFNWGPFKIKRSNESQRAIDNLYATAGATNPYIITKAQLAFVKGIENYQAKKQPDSQQYLDAVKQQEKIVIDRANDFLNKEDLSNRLENEFNDIEKQESKDNQISNELSLEDSKEKDDFIKID